MKAPVAPPDKRSEDEGSNLITRSSSLSKRLFPGRLVAHLRRIKEITYKYNVPSKPLKGPKMTDVQGWRAKFGVIGPSTIPLSTGF